jgi:hypothetical protein
MSLIRHQIPANPLESALVTFCIRHGTKSDDPRKGLKVNEGEDRRNH